MKLPAFPLRDRWVARLHAPLVVLLALLQRTPIVRVLQGSETLLARSPAVALLRSACAGVAALGTMQSLAGATTLVATQPSGINVNAGQEITPIGFTVTDTINIASWKIGGTLPPGLSLDAQQGGASLDGPGVLDATTAGYDDGYGTVSDGNITTTPVLRGTPTQAGTFTFSLQAFEMPALAGLASNIFNYTVVVAATLPTGTKPAMTTQPGAQSVTVGGTITLTAAATGSPAPTYQWQKNGQPIAGATGATLTIANAQTSDAGTYAVVVTNAAGSVTSDSAVVAVTAPTGTVPAFVRQPASTTVAAGSTAVLTAEAMGATSFQWQHNGAAVNGATSATLVLAKVSAADAGAYTVVASNATGPVTSNTASLAVSTDATFGHLINLSIRTTLTTANPSFTVGTVIGGAGGNKPLLIRAMGPSLGVFGITTAVAASTLEVDAGGSVIAANSGWAGDATLRDAATAVGAFPFESPTSQDAAVFNPSLPARDYTIQVGGLGGATGEVIAELYDASPAFSASVPRLVNVSVRKQIGGDERLIAGFVIGGNTDRTVLIRAIGPGLAAFGVPNTMPDPQLALFTGSNQIVANDNWGGDAQLTATGHGVGAFDIADPASKDAMILVTLAPGLYTAQVTGNGGGGDVLVEVYEVP